MGARIRLRKPEGECTKRAGDFRFAAGAQRWLRGFGLHRFGSHSSDTGRVGESGPRIGKESIPMDIDDADPESAVVPLQHTVPPTGNDLTDLVIAARNGDRVAWNALIQRFTPLVFSITCRYRLSRSDAEDVSQMVWLRMFENLRKLREPRALPGWIRTTTNNEALRVAALARRAEPMDPSVLARMDAQRVDESGVDRELLRLERDRAVVDGLGELTAELAVMLGELAGRLVIRGLKATLGILLGLCRCLVASAGSEANG